MKKIELKDNEYELLLMVLEDASDSRSSMGCNDDYEKEMNLFTLEERIEMQKKIFDDVDEDDADGYVGNWGYVDYLVDAIKEQGDE